MGSTTARGRRSSTLYAAPELDEAMLERRVAQVRTELELRLDVAPPEPGFGDIIALCGWMILGAAIWTWPYVLAAVLLG